jgi:hypothetical protein
MEPISKRVILDFKFFRAIFGIYSASNFKDVEGVEKRRR